ncbi:MAG: hypothetical protein A7316_01845 [Candidatus Altiarchaeales archaeon WOR_SM1_86-2]|nr:MAG: hypothetical protein A7316_01845 [Candidatus Altiarchaeales archaeon WOR_SM1_86-2]ODS38343.1 MAG: hypothetical protein A7315_12575 [Candidatus Altiarchaeales archaeon WOR_SM1_79]
MKNRLIPAGFVFAGIFLINSLPHIFFGVTGVSTYTPLALSQDQTVNLIGGILNFCFAILLLYFLRNASISIRNKIMYFCAGVVIAVIGLSLYHFDEMSSYVFWTVAIIAVFAYSYFIFKKEECEVIHAGYAQPENGGRVVPGFEGVQFYREPVLDCEGDVLNEDFSGQDAWSRWEKRDTDFRELYENASFLPGNVGITDVLNLKASYDGKDGSGCRLEYGGQVTYKPGEFSPDDEYTFSAIMKPTSQEGVVSAFFIHFIDGDTSDPGVCQNNHEIDIEVIKMADGELRAYFTTWTRAVKVWGGASGCEWIPEKWDDRQQEVNYIVLDERYAREFHRYSFKWMRDRIEFYIDDRFIVSHETVIPFHSAPLRINTWANLGWAGLPDETPSFIGSTEVKKVCISSSQTID